MYQTIKYFTDVKKFNYWANSVTYWTKARRKELNSVSSLFSSPSPQSSCKCSAPLKWNLSAKQPAAVTPIVQANQSKYLDSCVLSFTTSLNLGMPGSSQKGKDSLSQGRQEEMTSQNQANHFSTFFFFVLSLLEPRSGHKFGRQLIKCNFKKNISL